MSKYFKMDYIRSLLTTNKHTIHIGGKNGTRYKQISAIGSGATSKVYLCEEEKYKTKLNFFQFNMSIID